MGRSSISTYSSIIEAAVKLYAGMDVFEIGHAAAAQEDLEKTTKAVIRIVDEARDKRERAICFVTGVPGQAKHLWASMRYTNLN